MTKISKKQYRSKKIEEINNEIYENDSDSESDSDSLKKYRAGYFHDYPEYLYFKKKQVQRERLNYIWNTFDKQCEGQFSIVKKVYKGIFHRKIVQKIVTKYIGFTINMSGFLIDDYYNQFIEMSSKFLNLEILPIQLYPKVTTLKVLHVKPWVTDYYGDTEVYNQTHNLIQYILSQKNSLKVLELKCLNEDQIDNLQDICNILQNLPNLREFRYEANIQKEEQLVKLQLFLSNKFVQNLESFKVCVIISCWDYKQIIKQVSESIKLYQKQSKNLQELKISKQGINRRLRMWNEDLMEYDIIEQEQYPTHMDEIDDLINQFGIFNNLTIQSNKQQFWYEFFENNQVVNFIPFKNQQSIFMDSINYQRFYRYLRNLINKNSHKFKEYNICIKINIKLQSLNFKILEFIVSLANFLNQNKRIIKLNGIKQDLWNFDEIINNIVYQDDEISIRKCKVFNYNQGLEIEKTIKYIDQLSYFKNMKFVLNFTSKNLQLSYFMENNFDRIYYTDIKDLEMKFLLFQNDNIDRLLQGLLDIKYQQQQRRIKYLKINTLGDAQTMIDSIQKYYLQQDFKQKLEIIESKNSLNQQKYQIRLQIIEQNDNDKDSITKSIGIKINILFFRNQQIDIKDKKQGKRSENMSQNNNIKQLQEDQYSQYDNEDNQFLYQQEQEQEQKYQYQQYEKIENQGTVKKFGKQNNKYKSKIEYTKSQRGKQRIKQGDKKQKKRGRVNIRCLWKDELSMCTKKEFQRQLEQIQEEEEEVEEENQKMKEIEQKYENSLLKRLYTFEEYYERFYVHQNAYF